ncbi:RNA-directed DNA polymerase [Aeromonas veronii]|uniref:RNA-directed DNA polymerase n=1 Tax=Aeromonas veronii TaxID=654 RepID=UPI0038B52648
MQSVTLAHFERAIDDIVSNGENDTLPFEVDGIFISDNKDNLASLCYSLFERLEKSGKKDAINIISQTIIFHERLLTPTGPSGFRISTKIHPFWNVYLNGLAVAIAEENEKNRLSNAHSYRFNPCGKDLFIKEKSWRSYKNATLVDPSMTDTAIVIQADISSFYEHIYHHRVENCINDLFSSTSTVSAQIDRILNQLSSGRSFGLPVGGQCSRVLAELLMTHIDQLLTNAGIIWHRYVDDFTIIAKDQADAYRAISVLSNILADYGLSLNKTKTTLLNAPHYKNFITAQLFSTEDNASKLKEIDLYFDPYSDNPQRDYEELQETVEKLEIQDLLNMELGKSQPDNFLITQISRTLKLHQPYVALQLCQTLLAPNNIHSFRASWATIIRGVNSIRANNNFEPVHETIDVLIDQVIKNASHLLLPETNLLHFLRLLKTKKNPIRAHFVYSQVFEKTNSETLKRACIDCLRSWQDRSAFIQMRNKWNSFHPEVQRMFWLASFSFGEEGGHFRKQVQKSLQHSWSLNIDVKEKPTFQSIYIKWTEHAISKASD